MKKLFLFDIEGTTTDISFVHQVLFPYAYEKMEPFIHEHGDRFEANLNTIASTREDQILKLKTWIKEDKKHPVLKEIQGELWQSGYEKGEFTGHLYPDVLPFWKKIKQNGNEIGIYSSGSVWAQKLLFKHSDFGDLTPMISFYFDTKVGGKRESSSYENILKDISFESSDVTFFSDIPEELQAASEVGIKTFQLLRPGTKPSGFASLQDFNQFVF